MNQQSRTDHVQLRGLYRSLLESQSHFDEFKSFLIRYPNAAFGADEPQVAAGVRAQLNARIAAWLGGNFDGLSAGQVRQWREVVLADEFLGASENEECHDVRGLPGPESRAW